MGVAVDRHLGLALLYSGGLGKALQTVILLCVMAVRCQAATGAHPASSAPDRSRDDLVVGAFMP